MRVRFIDHKHAIQGERDIDIEVLKKASFCRFEGLHYRFCRIGGKEDETMVVFMRCEPPLIVGDEQNEAALAIGAEAFRAGYEAGKAYAGGAMRHNGVKCDPDAEVNCNLQWDAYEPSEEVRGLM